MNSDNVVWAGGQSFGSPEEIECSFCYQLYDVVLLLGGRKEFADMVKKIPDRNLTKNDFNRLNIYAIELIGLAKARIADLNSITIQKEPTNE